MMQNKRRRKKTRATWQCSAIYPLSRSLIRGSAHRFLSCKINMLRLDKRMEDAYLQAYQYKLKEFVPQLYIFNHRDIYYAKYYWG